MAETLRAKKCMVSDGAGEVGKKKELNKLRMCSP